MYEYVAYNKSLELKGCLF